MDNSSKQISLSFGEDEDYQIPNNQMGYFDMVEESPEVIDDSQDDQNVENSLLNISLSFGEDEGCFNNLAERTPEVIFIDDSEDEEEVINETFDSTTCNDEVIHDVTRGADRMFEVDLMMMMMSQESLEDVTEDDEEIIEDNLQEDVIIENSQDDVQIEDESALINRCIEMDDDEIIEAYISFSDLLQDYDCMDEFNSSVNDYIFLDINLDRLEMSNIDSEFLSSENDHIFRDLIY